ncbi:MAG: hypothetical protein AAGD25_37105 [Cyanobacteria bacterium P01_F01_bin.150]
MRPAWTLALVEPPHQKSRWHYRIRVPHNTVIHTAPGAMFEVRTCSSRGNAIGYQGVSLWEKGELKGNLMMGNLDNAKPRPVFCLKTGTTGLF